MFDDRLAQVDCVLDAWLTGGLPNQIKPLDSLRLVVFIKVRHVDSRGWATTLIHAECLGRASLVTGAALNTVVATGHMRDLGFGLKFQDVARADLYALVAADAQVWVDREIPDDLRLAEKILLCEGAPPSHPTYERARHDGED